jgi:hypothetical protein
LAQGDAKGAAITGLSIAASYIPVYGWAVAAVIQIANMCGLFGSEDPPKSTAWFGIDAYGNVITEIGGDSEMRGAAEYYANPMLDVLQNYGKSGGRLVLPDEPHLPRVVVEAGEPPKILFGGEKGSSTSIAFRDAQDGAQLMRDVLIARDKGGYVADAIQLASDAMGNINLDQVAAILAGYGFTQNGSNFSFGEDNSERQGIAVGTGQLAGGGQQGPEGAKLDVTKVVSQPLQPEQLPSQQQGAIIASINLDQTFTGPGAGLMMAALLAEGALAEQVLR